MIERCNELYNRIIIEFAMQLYVCFILRFQIFENIKDSIIQALIY